VCLTLCRSSEPLLAVIHDSHQGTTCWAIKGYGAFSGNRRLGPPHHARADSETTVSWLQGYDVTKADEFPCRIRGALETRFKRVLQTWAPSIDWVLLAHGGIGAVMAYRNGAEDLIGGMLLAAEVGYRVVDSRTEPTGELGTDVVVVGADQPTNEILGILKAERLGGGSVRR